MKLLKNLLPGSLPGATDDPARRTTFSDPSATIQRALAAAGLSGGPAAGPAQTSARRDRLANVLLQPTPWPARATPAATMKPVDTIPRPGFGSGRHDGPHGARDYKLFMPTGHADRPLPLLVMLHGCTQDPDDFAAGTGMNDLAQAHGVIVLYPAQAARSNGSKCWNWFQPGDQRRDQGEPALLAGMTGHVMATQRVDADRVHVAGLSAGGAMAAILGREYPDIFASIGVHSGLPPGAAHDVASAFAVMKNPGPATSAPHTSQANPGNTIPVIVFHGDSDRTVHPANGRNIVAGHTNTGSWREQTGTIGRDYTRRTLVGSDGRTHAEHWEVHGADHAWSGGHAQGSYTDRCGPDASAEMLRFFREHPRGPLQAAR